MGRPRFRTYDDWKQTDPADFDPPPEPPEQEYEYQDREDDGFDDPPEEY